MGYPLVFMYVAYIALNFILVGEPPKH